MQEGNNNKLKTATIWLMISVALFYDVIQILFSWMGLGWLIMPIFYLHFWFWFKIHGVKFFTMKRAKGLGIGGLLEAATAGIIPGFTFNVFMIAMDNRLHGVGEGITKLDIMNKK